MLPLPHTLSFAPASSQIFIVRVRVGVGVGLGLGLGSGLGLGLVLGLSSAFACCKLRGEIRTRSESQLPETARALLQEVFVYPKF